MSPNPREGTVDPLSGGGTLKTAFVVFLISLLALMVVFGWWMLNRA